MEATLSAVKRDTRGKNEARRLRAEGRIPAVLYGGADGAVAVAVDAKTLTRILHSEAGLNSLIALELEGERGDTRVLVKDFQLDPIRHSLLHADFYRVAMDKAITVTVQVVLRGEPRGVKQQGGIIDFPNREVELECLPGDIPESIEVDVSELLVGQSVRLKDVLASVKWTPISDPDTMLVHLVPARVTAEEGAAEVAAVLPTSAEPEVIKKGKTEKEGE
jgi:large subunit ribosomal protein L25